MGQQTAEQLAQRVFDLGLITDRQLRQVWGDLGSHHVAPDDFLQMLVRRELLTNYQVERLLKGDKTGFFFGDYKVLYLVGAGSFARVYRAVHVKTGQVVAVKVLRKRFSENPVQYRQFVREGLLGRALRHENIVPIYEVVSKKTEHFLVMEFVEGRDLRQFVKVRKKIEPIEAVRLMSEITSGLRYAFERALTHRDLKISNVLISSSGTAKLVDFGLASIDVTLNDSGGLPSGAPNSRTVDYAALERATGVRRDDPRSDIFFLGCIFYHMLTGRAALKETRDRVQRLSKTRFLEIVPVQKVDPSIPHSASIVVNKALVLDPERRYQTPGAMLSDLRIATRRLTGTKDDETDGEGQAADADGSAVVAQNRFSVMVVESNGEMQNVFREGFKRAGYRVLITSNSQLVFTRFQQDPDTADSVIFNAQEIGRPALDVFNRFAESTSTQDVPALLLLDEAQVKWKPQARTAPHRLVLQMPLTMRKLRAAISHVMSRRATDAAESEGP